MRNLLDEVPARELHGGPAHAARLVDPPDLAGRDVLDIGCGFGWFELHALDHDVASVTGTEINDANLTTARAHIVDDRAVFAVGDATSLPFADESFDTVVCWDVLEHIPRRTEPQAFAEVARVLRPGGRLYLSTPYASLVARALDPAWWLIGHRHYKAGDLQAFAVDAGLDVELLEVRGGIWQIAAVLNLYVAKWLFRRGPFFEAAVNARMDREMLRMNGYATCFLKCRRPA